MASRVRKGRSSRDRLDPATQKAVDDVIRVCECDSTTAYNLLRCNNMNPNAAIHAHFESLQDVDSRQTKLDSKSIGKVFQNYRNPANDTIHYGDKLNQFFADLNMSDLASFQVLVFCWKFKLSKAGVITRSEFEQGMRSAECDSMDKLRRRCDMFVNELHNRERFKDLYNWAFQFGLAPNKKSLDGAHALTYWKWLLTNRFALSGAFLDFYQNKLTKESHTVTKDTWKLLLDFLSTHQNVHQHDEESAWPVLVDDFVQFEKERLNQGGTPMEY